MPRFFVGSEQIQGNMITLSGDDAFHISRSLRMAKGEHITVSDAAGSEYDCVLRDFLPDRVLAEVVSVSSETSEAPVKLYLYQALPKGDKLDTVIQKSVECGVHEIVLLESERCIAKTKKEAEDRKSDRRARIALEAAKQSGRGYVPCVRGVLSFRDAVSEATEKDLCLFCYEGEHEQTIKAVLSECEKNGKMPMSLSIVIGSEGGFSKEEAMLAKARGACLVSLGKRILRTETVSTFVLGCLSYALEM